MNKDNVFCSSKFYLAVGDILHIYIIDEVGSPIEVELSGDEDNYAPSAPVATAATSVTETSFTANWYFNENTTGYYLDVATDSAFTAMVAGYDNHNAGNNNSHAVTGLTGETNYYYRVRAYNDYGTSGNSNIINLTTSVWYNAFYNWWAVNSGLLAPTGWHVPSETEFNSLITYLGSDAGKHMKEIGISHWKYPNAQADNSSGFTALGSTYRNSFGVFAATRGADVYYRTSTVHTTVAHTVYIDYTNSTATMTTSPNKTGSPVRCVKDSTILTNGQVGTMIDIDGNTYGTICIDGVEWMSADLRTTKYNDNTPITLVTDATAWAALATEAMCWYNNVAP